MDLRNFVNACEERLKRAELVLNNPSQLETELKELEELLRIEWPDAILTARGVDLEPEDKEKIVMIFNKIKKIELNTKTRVSFFDGIENFIQQSDNR